MADKNFTQPDGVALRDYMEGRLAALREYIDTRLTGDAKASELAAETLKDRLAGMNEVRETLRDQATRFVARSELDLKLEKITADIEDLKRSRDMAAGKASQTSVIISMLFGLAGLVIGIISLLT